MEYLKSNKQESIHFAGDFLCHSDDFGEQDLLH